MMADQDGPDEPSVRRVMTDQGNKAQRLLRVDQIYSRKDRQVHFAKTVKARAKPDRFGKTALVVRRIISNKGMVAKTEVDIKSTLLKDLFLEIYAGVHGLELNKTPPVADPELFFHAMPHLARRKGEEKEKPKPDLNLIDDIGTALRFVEEDFADVIASHNSLVANGQITWDLIWTICPPNTVILAPKHGLVHQMQGLKLASSSYQQRPNQSRYFHIRGAIITRDGTDFGWGHLDLEIDQFDGTKEITGLTAFPLQYSHEHEALSKRLVARGRKYLSIIDKPTCLEYAEDGRTAMNGVTETEIILPDGERKTEKFNARGRIMVDAEAYAVHNPSSNLIRPYVFPSYTILTRDLSEGQLIFCAYWINGFSFLSKTWGQLMVESMSDIVWNNEAFKKLVMKEERRTLVHDLVKAHRQDEKAFDDIVQNKGRGLVCLLAGSPGVGKTLTAEVVAETTRRPLYTVGTGELGIDADLVDRRLGTILETSRRWGCVLLIDEADVFLSLRGQNLATDTLVSIFLRRIEYFRGVLILTTNRQSQIDPAFESRIHFTINYPDLNEESRTEVWRNFISTAANVTGDSPVDKEGIARLAKRELNGRQIKNAISCATSLARERGVPLTVEGIEHLLDVL